MESFTTRWVIEGRGPYAETAVQLCTSLRGETFLYSPEHVQKEDGFSYLLYVGSLPFGQQQQTAEEELHHFLAQWIQKCKQSPANTVTLLLVRPFLPGTVQRLQQLFKDQYIQVSVASFPLLGLKLAAGQTPEWQPPAFIIGTTEQGKVLKHLRRELVRSGCPVMLMPPREAEMLNHLYINESIKKSHIQQLAASTAIPKYDWITILRGLGLHQEMGQQFFCAADVSTDWVCRMVQTHLLIDNPSRPVIAVWHANGSRAGEVKNKLEQIGCEVHIYSPESQANGTSRLKLFYGKWETVKAAHALVILEQHKEFSQIMLAEWESHLPGKDLHPLIIDCCGLYEPEEMTSIGCRYIAFGRERTETF